MLTPEQERQTDLIALSALRLLSEHCSAQGRNYVAIAGLHAIEQRLFRDYPEQAKGDIVDYSLEQIRASLEVLMNETTARYLTISDANQITTELIDLSHRFTLIASHWEFCNRSA